MTALVEFLKSRGKMGAIGLIVLGIAHMALVFFGKIVGGYEVGGGLVLAGISLLGIRGNQDKLGSNVKAVEK